MFDSSSDPITGSEIAATALTRRRVCAGSSDHSLLVDGISTNISDIMCKRVSEISDEKEL